MAAQNPTYKVGDSSTDHAADSFVTRMRKAAPWWLYPTTVVVCLSAFSVYVLWSALHGNGQFGPYLSPFFSPQVLVGRTPIPAAFWVLWAPLVFRGTCYYYRKSYHRAFLWDPPTCAHPELRKREYHGETRLPLLLNNLHRYTMYAIVVVTAFLWWDTINAFHYGGHLYVGLGSMIMLVNVILLTGYVFGCHSVRHLIGGKIDCYSCVRGGNARHSMWNFLTKFNERHAMWAWISMFSVASVDIYIRILQAGAFIDPHFTLF